MDNGIIKVVFRDQWDYAFFSFRIAFSCAPRVLWIEHMEVAVLRILKGLILVDFICNAAVDGRNWKQKAIWGAIWAFMVASVLIYYPADIISLLKNNFNALNPYVDYGMCVEDKGLEYKLPCSYCNLFDPLQYIHVHCHYTDLAKS